MSDKLSGKAAARRLFAGGGFAYARDAVRQSVRGKDAGRDDAVRGLWFRPRDAGHRAGHCGHFQTEERGTMKNISWAQLCFTFVGVFLGAGFVSGQELWQFFACFGAAGLAGFLVSAGIMTAAHGALLGLVRSTGEGRIGFLMTSGDSRLLRTALLALQYLFLFGVVVIMIAGAAESLAGLTGLPTRLLGALVTAVVFVLALCGLQSLVASFSALVPVITVCAVIIAAIVVSGGKGTSAEFTPEASMLRPSWYVSAVTYAAYNLFGSLTTMIPLAGHIPDGKTLRKGLLCGSVVLLAIAMSMIAAMLVCPEAGQDELPMITLAGRISPLLKTGYSVLMTLSMVVSALGCVFALLQQLELQTPKLQKKEGLLNAVLCALAFAFSRFGFGTLIGVFYPICGYLGIPFVAMLFFNWKRAKKEAKA